ncbi:hypothetical protein [Burkholderia sp. BCC0322]|nr:hypothetical protein [Burkholderia sp. BCC0322]
MTVLDDRGDLDGHLEVGEAEIEGLAEAAFEFPMHALPDPVR